MAITREHNKKLQQLSIIEGARELFLNKKYHAIQVEEIAKLAGMAKKTFYAYFPSKLSLFMKIFEDYLQQLHSELAIISTLNLPPDESLLKSFEILYTFTKKNRKFMRLYWQVDSENFDGEIPDEMINRITFWNKTILNESKAFITKAQDKGFLLQYDPLLLTHMISAINKGLFIQANKENKFRSTTVDSDELYNEFVKLFKDSFRK